MHLKRITIRQQDGDGDWHISRAQFYHAPFHTFVYFISFVLTCFKDKDGGYLVLNILPIYTPDQLAGFGLAIYEG